MHVVRAASFERLLGDHSQDNHPGAIPGEYISMSTHHQGLMVGTLPLHRFSINRAGISTLATPSIAFTKKKPADNCCYSKSTGRVTFEYCVSATGCRSWWLSRRPCSFASPPFGGFACSSRLDYRFMRLV